MAPGVSNPIAKHQKLLKLPQNAKISKRRLTRQPITSKSSSHKEQIIYISSRTPFMSAVSRIRKHVSQIQKRRSQSVAATSSKRGAVPLHKAKGDRILAAAIESLDRQDAAAAARASAVEEVHVKGTGKAVEKVLAVAGWLQDRAAEEGVRVMLETGSWWAVDDVEVVDKEDFEAEDTVGNARNGMEIDKEDQNEENGRREDIPDSRLRSVSVLTLRVAVL